MPKYKPSNIKEKSAKKTVITSKQTTPKNTIWDIFKFGESYMSLFMGIVVVVIATVMLLTFVKGKNNPAKLSQQQQLIGVQTQQNIPIITQTQNLPKTEQNNSPKNQTISGTTYTVTEGDNLWKIAEKKYNSGYNWVDIQKANKITNPDVLLVGTKLTLPNVQSKIATVVKPNTGAQQVVSSLQTSKISGSNYTIVNGDTLWDIAVRAYGDGYSWTKIAKANKYISNPDLIYSGNKLTIPRV